jgi:hypothetical protein
LGCLVTGSEADGAGHGPIDAIHNGRVTVVVTHNTAPLTPDNVDKLLALLRDDVPAFNIGATAKPSLDVLARLLDKDGR